MNCRDVRKALPSYIDGLLDFDTTFAVRAHLNTCPDCRAVLRKYEQDSMALTNHLQRAPYAPVARDILDEIHRQQSPWWDALRTGGYRVAGAAGLLVVLLVVLSGAYALREVANTDNDEDPPQQEVMLGQDDQSDSGDEAGIEMASDENVIGEERIPEIIEILDENGLVFDVNEVSETDSYTIEYRRVAVDRRMMFVEYRAEQHDEDAEVLMTARAGNGGSHGIPFEDGVAEGWMVFPAGGEHASSEVVLEDNLANEGRESAPQTHEVSVELSSIPRGDEQVQEYDSVSENNGIEACCLVVERGVAVSTLRWDRELVNPDEAVYLDESLQPVDDPPALDASADPGWPEVTVDGEPLQVLDRTFFTGTQAESEHERIVNVLGLPEEGMLAVQEEHTILPTDGEEPNWTYYQGPWALQVELQGVESEPDSDPTPEPTPELTTPSDVAEEDEATLTPEATPDPEDETDEEDTLRVLVYQLRDGEIAASSREIEYTRDVATASMEELLDGLSQDDADFGLETAIPEGTELLDIRLMDRTVTVDLSEEFAEGGIDELRVAQVVHTLTQFQSIDNVQMFVEGEPAYEHAVDGLVIDEPVDRADFEDVAPPILLETPTPGEVVSGPLVLRGTSNTFEANMQIEVIDASGEVIYRDHAMASSGTGTRGDFDVTIPLELNEEGWGTVRMFENSARDGSRTNVIEIPVQFEVGCVSCREDGSGTPEADAGDGESAPEQTTPQTSP